MKAGIFDPYLDTIGGGERYALTVAEALLKKGWRVDLFWPDKEIKEKLIQNFALEIERVNFVSYSPWKRNLLNRWNFEWEYDLLFYLSDGSVPMMLGRRNLLHFQVPFKNLRPTIKNKIKLETIDKIICNSLFTKQVIDGRLKVNSTVIYPPVDVGSIKPGKKEDVILSVGRFSQLLQGKRQDVLVRTFKEMVDRGGLEGWKLILAGGSEIGGREFLGKIRKMAEDYPIEIVENPNFARLVRLYGKARIFWTASGYGIDEEKEPEKVEHFGITTVEAMAAGCIPIVMRKGGQKEIVQDGENGFLWETVEELIEKTKRVVSGETLARNLSVKASLRSQDFSKEEFYEQIYNF